jgi:cephalosporin hydroxylase
MIKAQILLFELTDYTFYREGSILMFERFRRFYTRFAMKAGFKKPEPELGSFVVHEAQRRALRANPPTPVHEAFFQYSSRPAHKWAHYLDIYNRYLDGRRDTSAFLLEIGVLEGGSLDMWRRYLGDKAKIVGIDINPACVERVDAPNIVHIGSQADRSFLEGIVAEHGRPDVILDDGSHVATHQRASFDILFPLLQMGGLYILEDTHTSYWNDWDGGYRRSGTAIEMSKNLVDDMHAWYHTRPNPAGWHEQIGAIHFHDSMIVIEKSRTNRPGMISSNED